MADVFSLVGDEFEMVVHGHDPSTGLRAIIAVHSTALGPALGGVRFFPYASEDDALHDVLRLAKGMSYKAAAAGLDLGGGKAVVIGDPRTDRTPALLTSFARLVHTLGGHYITAADVGVTSADIDLLATVTPHVGGASGASGDPSPVTAWGVLHAIGAVLDELHGSGDVAGAHVAVQGVGKVGGSLCRLLADRGARLTVADVDRAAAEALAAEVGADVVAPDEVLLVACDVLAPCALGAVFDDASIPKLRARGVAGGANNQLAEGRHGDALHAAGVIYAPDYVANAGGLINIEDERYGYLRERALAKAATIGDRVRAIFERARTDAISPAAAAERLAHERLQAARPEPARA